MCTVSDEATKVASNDAMPGCALAAVELLLDVLSNILRQNGQSMMHVNGYHVTR